MTTSLHRQPQFVFDTRGRGPISSVNLYDLYLLGLLVTALVYLSYAARLLWSDVIACKTNLFRLMLVTFLLNTRERNIRMQFSMVSGTLSSVFGKMFRTSELHITQIIYRAWKVPVLCWRFDLRSLWRNSWQADALPSELAWACNATYSRPGLAMPYIASQKG